MPALDFDPASPDGMEHLLRALDHERLRLKQEVQDTAGQLIACLRSSLDRLEIQDPKHRSLIREIQDITGEIEREMESLALH